MSAASTLAGRLGRHFVIYGSAGAATLALGLVNVAVITRLLAPHEFGQVATYLVFGGMRTILYNLGSLQGSFRVAWGGGDEDIGVDDFEEDDEHAATDKRLALGTGLLLTAMVALFG